MTERRPPGGPDPDDRKSTFGADTPDGPQTAWEASGSVFQRAKHPVKSSGEEKDGSGLRAGDGGKVPGADPRGPQPLGSPPNPTDSRLSAERGVAHVGTVYQGSGGYAEVDIQAPRREDVDRRAEKRAERWVSLWFVAAALAAVGFAIAYGWGDLDAAWYTPVLGATMAVALAGVGIGMVIWAKKLMPDEEAVQQREPHFSAPEEAATTAEAFRRGFAETGAGHRSLVRRTFLGAMAALGLLAVPPLLSLGPHPNGELGRTRWARGKRLVTDDGAPVRIGALPIGGILTVFPEDETDLHAKADSTVLLIRLRPGENEPRRGREDWAVDGHVAYSKICSHAGCPVSLYEQQTHHLLCPCHQSVFDVIQHCRPIFGPAARPLPQLPIEIDEEGFFRARSDFTEPVGPSYWERT
jgi:ubiquinol-cytochrome c reductase iron-sulfur subunit